MPNPLVSTSVPVDVHVANDSRVVMGLLAGGVPLTLLIDLVTPTHSAEIYAREGGDGTWITRVA